MTTNPRKPRKMPKNQRAYPKKNKPRLIEVTGSDLAYLLEHQHEIGIPVLYCIQIHKFKYYWANAADMTKWRRGSRGTSSAEQT